MKATLRIVGVLCALIPAQAQVLMSQHRAVDSTDYLQDATPFDCNGNLYLFQSTTSTINTRFNQVNPDGSLGYFGEANDGAGVTQINAIGFNVQDGLIYGYSPDQDYGGHVLATDANGVVYDLGRPGGFSLNAYFAGDVDGQGNLYLKAGNSLVKIDLDQFPLQGEVLNVDYSETNGRFPSSADFAIDPFGIAWGFDQGQNRLFRIDLNSNPVKFTYESDVSAPAYGTGGTGKMGTFGGLYFDAFGTLYGYLNSSTNGNPSGLYYFDIQTGFARIIAQGERVSRNDGAACAYAVGFKKFVTPNPARPGAKVTYRFGISNWDVTGADFTGVVVEDVLSVNHGGSFTGKVSMEGIDLPGSDFSISSEAGGTNNSIRIENIRVPKGGITYVDAEVQLSNSTPFGAVLENQATVSDNSGQVPEGLSWSPVSIGPSPTELAIIEPPTLTKSISKSNLDLGDLPAALQYTFTFNNPNPGNLTDVTFRDELPIGTYRASSLSLDFGGSINNYANTNLLVIEDMSIPSGVSSFSVDILVDQGESAVGTWLNQAELFDSFGDTPAFTVLSTNEGDPVGSETKTPLNISEVITADSDLELTKVVDVSTVEVGDIVTFTVVIRNQGPDAVEELSIKDHFPLVLTYLDESVTAGSYDRSSGVWKLSNFPASKTETLTISARVEELGYFSNTAEVITSTSLDPDSSPDNYGNNPNEDDGAQASISSVDSSSGSSGGLESNRSLASKIARRNFERNRDAAYLAIKRGEKEYPRFVKSQKSIDHSLINSGSLGLESLIPEVGPESSIAFETTPQDIVDITNANAVLAVDYVGASDSRRKGVIFATETDPGATYEHSKVVCDRLIGAQLLEVKEVLIDGIPMLMSVLEHRDGSRDFAISFVVSQNGDIPELHYRFVHSELELDGEGGSIFNYQIWSPTPEHTSFLVREMLNRLELSGGQIAVESAVPDFFVKSVEIVNNQVVLNLKGENVPNELSVVGTLNRTETSYPQAVEASARVVAGNDGEYLAKVNLGPLFDVQIDLKGSDDVVQDQVYIADGAWGISQDGGSVVDEFEIRVGDSFDGSGRSVSRDVSMAGFVNEWVALFRFMRPGLASADLTEFGGMSFEISGNANVKIVVEKEGITDWDQYSLTIPVREEAELISVSFDDFERTGDNSKLDPSDITQIVFYIEGNGTPERFDLQLKSVRLLEGDVESSFRDIPESIILEQNYPNPFNPETTISFGLAEKTIVSLNIFDTLGRKVREITSGSFDAGFHAVKLDASDLPSGTYFYMVEAGAKTLSKKMTLAK